ncbi:hypothetical protein FRX31_016648 [Thalictrum thalictroides]|uniref:Uncharacterized protein n=1 Tax=Thalictrum thalictroides TaxID=46969 RepID=A0A7J6W8K7_THATH|nr:hypothetical protein FRX31_016648 [Thalictrum thalictroides]
MSSSISSRKPCNLTDPHLIPAKSVTKEDDDHPTNRFVLNRRYLDERSSPPSELILLIGSTVSDLDFHLSLFRLSVTPLKPGSFVRYDLI